MRGRACEREKAGRFESGGKRGKKGRWVGVMEQVTADVGQVGFGSSWS